MDSSLTRWQLGQCFGEKDSETECSEADILSVVEFDGSGDYLATGDHGGRIVVFERVDSGKKSGKGLQQVSQRPHASTDEMEDIDMYPNQNNISADYRFYTEFQSHESSFDYLKSLEIEEKINQIAWCPRASSSLCMLTANDYTVKLWKVHDRAMKEVTSLNIEMGRYGGRTEVSSLRLPTIINTGSRQPTASTRRVYADTHTYHINSISVNADGSSFITADDLRINMWNLDVSNRCFNILDIRPPSLDQLTEVVTSTAFHPIENYTFMYSTSRGTLKLGDLRQSALCDTKAKIYEEPDEDEHKPYLSEITASISDMQFSRDGVYLIARDYLNVKVWDRRNERQPVRVVPVHDHLRPKLQDLYEMDRIFDKFRVAVSPDGNQVLSGSYNNCFKIFDFTHGMETSIELTKARPKDPRVRPIVNGIGINNNNNNVNMNHDVDMNDYLDHSNQSDFTRKVVHYSYHPFDNIIAVAGLNNLYIYHSPQ